MLSRASRGCPRRASPFWSAAPAAPTYSTKRRPPKSRGGFRLKRAVSAARSSFPRVLEPGHASNHALAAEIAVPAEILLWSKQKGPNPYRSFLAAAGRFIVTSDSVSMAMEVLATGKPVSLYRLPQHLGLRHSLIERLHAAGIRAPFDRGWMETRPDRDRFFADLIAEGSLAIFPNSPARAFDTGIFAEVEKLAVERVRPLVIGQLSGHGVA